MSKKAFLLCLITLLVLVFAPLSISYEGAEGSDTGSSTGSSDDFSGSPGLDTPGPSSDPSPGLTEGGIGSDSGGDSGGGGGSWCGNSVCESWWGESCSSCPQDCGSCCAGNAGQACGGCGRGRINCGGGCDGDYSACGGSGWSNTGSGCGNCGTQQQYCNGCDWTGSYQCVGQGSCSPGQAQYDGGCGNCGTLRSDCAGNCQWGGWYCVGENPNYGQACGSCGGKIQCNGACSISTPSNYGQSCGNCGTIDCSGNCVNQGVCSPGQTETQTQNCGGGSCGTQSSTRTCTSSCGWGGWSSWSSCTLKSGNACFDGQTQCSNGRYQSCSNCAWQNSGTNADGDAKDKECGDSLCDNAAGVYDSTKTATETNCADGLDNDCDGKTDCNDNDCDGSITGTVKNHDNQLISSADVSAKKDLTTIKSSTTNQQGNYLISPINCGAYNLVASHPDYAPQTKTNIVVNPFQQTTANFDGESSLVFGTSCEADCTFASDSIIHASCDNKNGCTFYDSIAKAACDNSQPGWVRDYDASHYVTCASGSPQPKVEIEASVSCSSGTLVKVTRIVVYNGKPVKLVVATCG